MVDWFLSLRRDTDTTVNDLRSSPKIVTPYARLEIIPQVGHTRWIDELDLCAERTRAFLDV